MFITFPLFWFTSRPSCHPEIRSSITNCGLSIYVIFVSTLKINLAQFRVTTSEAYLKHCPDKKYRVLGFENVFFCVFCLLRDSPQWARASSFMRFLDHKRRRTTVGRAPRDEWSARRRDLYLTTHNNHNRKASVSPVVFEPTISGGDRPQTYALDRAANGEG
jgi:hypothetical protein